MSKKNTEYKCKRCGKTANPLYLSDDFEDLCKDCFDADLYELLRAVCYYKDEESTLKSARNELDLFKALAAKAGGEV